MQSPLMILEVFHDDTDGNEFIVSYKYLSDEGSGFTSLTDRHMTDKLILKTDDLTWHYYIHTHKKHTFEN